MMVQWVKNLTAVAQFAAEVQWVKGSGIATAVVQVAAVAWIPSLAQELPLAMGVATKKKKKQKKQKKTTNPPPTKNIY